FSNKANISLQFSRSDYVQQIAGGLTDAQFNANAKESERARNYFQPFINIPALIFNYDLSSNTHLEVTSHAIIGERNSVQYINTPNIADTFNTVLNSFNPRQVDRDYYNGFTTEARLLHHYKMGKVTGTLAGGLRYFNQVTKRKQKGIGTTGYDFDLTLVKPYSNDLRLKTHNYAAFIENIFQVTPRLSVTPGVRYEMIRTDLSGVFSSAMAPISYKGKRNFPLFGAGLQYQVNQYSQIYANASQAYRPYLYANATPADRVDKVDLGLKDSKGYDIDLGYRGHYKNVFHFDVNAYYLFYGDRVGLITQKNPDNTSYLYTTNIGNSVSKGVELYVEFSLLKLIDKKQNANDIRLFNSVAYNSSKYTSGEMNRAGINTSVKGNYVENSPEWINRSGVSLQFGKFTSSINYSFTGKNFNDAFNTASSVNAVTGIIPAYHVWDCSFNWQFTKQYRLSGGINNFTDERYFNRRITFYPGPGILPADGRTFYVTAGIKI
ncbi:MAG TPA: TonB-dependent receptor, partial [Panacibacter sp.]|nr:TonB-dependent receptor [Panacibacter sp.]